MLIAPEDVIPINQPESSARAFILPVTYYSGLFRTISCASTFLLRCQPKPNIYSHFFLYLLIKFPKNMECLWGTPNLKELIRNREELIQNQKYRLFVL